MTDLREVEQKVLAVLHDLSGLEPSRISADHRLLQDLSITGDDLSFVFVPEVERALGVKTDPAAWNQVATVQQAIAVFASSPKLMD